MCCVIFRNATRSSGISWTRLSGLDAVRETRAVWDAAARARQRTPFCASGFTIAALQAYHAVDAPALVVARDRDRTLGLMPLVDRPIARFGVTVREVGFPRNPQMIVNDPLVGGCAERSLDVLGALLDGALSTGADTVIADHLPADAGLPEAVGTAAARHNLRCDAPTPSRALYHATLPGEWDTYLATRSRNHRWQIRRALRRVDDAQDVTVVRHTGRAAIREQLQVWFGIERLSWQGRDPAAAMGDADRHFHRLLLETLPDDEVGALWLMHLRGEPAAALRMLASPGRRHVHTMHFAAHLADAAPGLATFAAMMRDACTHGLTEVDLHGTSDFFARWATGSRSHASVRVYRRGWRGALLQAVRRAR